MELQSATYILASKHNGTLCVGSTRDLVKRIWEHKSDFVEGFTKKYRVHHLVYYEIHESYDAALARERQIKKWNRAWKSRLIEDLNPEWKDLFKEIL